MAIAPIRPLRDERKNGLLVQALVLSVVIHAAALAWPVSHHAAEQRLLPPLFAILRLLPPARDPQEAQPVASAAAVARPRPVPPAPLPTRRLLAVPAPAAATVPSAADVPLPPAVSPSALASTAELPAERASSAAPASSARREAADAEALERYIQSLSELLARQQRYPRLAELRGWEGKVQLRVRVARKGNIVAVELLHSSGFSVLDQHAVQMVQDAVPPPPPAGLQDGEFQITVPIHYKLQKST